jgi:hypothetical protein
MVLRFLCMCVYVCWCCRPVCVCDGSRMVSQVWCRTTMLCSTCVGAVCATPCCDVQGVNLQVAPCRMCGVLRKNTSLLCVPAVCAGCLLGACSAVLAAAAARARAAGMPYLRQQCVHFHDFTLITIRAPGHAHWLSVGHHHAEQMQSLGFTATCH